MEALKKRINVLTHILDDDKDMNEILQEVFHLNGLTNYKFFEESDAFLAAFDDRVHIAVVDYHLVGRLNGLDIIKICRSINKNCKVIMVSGQLDPNVFIELINMKIDGYINKNESNYMSKVASFVQDAIADLKEQFDREEILEDMRAQIRINKINRAV